MSVRKKTFIIIFLTFLVLLVVLFFTSRWFVFQDANVADEKSTTRDTTRLLAALDNKIAGLDATVSDWAPWDDTYAFINGDDPGYIASNLPDNSAFTNIGIELMLFIDNSGQIVFGKMVDLESGTDIPIPKGFNNELHPGSGLLSHKDTTDKISGILLLPEGPMIVASQPIVTSQGKGPIRGTLIMARRLDQAEIASLSQLTQLSITAFPNNETVVPGDVAVARKSLVGAKTTFVAPQSQAIVSGYALLNDIYGSPALIVRVDSHREAYTQAKTSMLYLGLALLAVGLVMGLVTMLLLEKMVIFRLTGLNTSVMKIASQGTASSRVETSGNDEIFVLATSVNSMLDSLENSLVKERESEERFKHLASISPVGIFRTDQNGTTTYVNPMWCQISGLSVDEALDKGWLQAVHPEDKENITKGWQETIQLHKSSFMDYRFMRPDGTVAWVMGQAIPEMNSENQIVGYIGTVTDISERIRAEAAQRQSEFLFRTLFELSPDAVILIDPHDPNIAWPIVDCNASACLMNGYSRDELIGHPIDILNADASDQTDRIAYLDRLREAGNLKYEVFHRHKNGTLFPIEVSSSIIKVGERELFIGIDRDISARKQAEEQIKQRLAELEAVNRISTALRAAQTVDEMLPTLLDTTLEVLHATLGAVWLHDPVKKALQMKVIRGWDTKPGRPSIPSDKFGEGVNGYAFATGQPYVGSDFHLDARLPEAVRQWMPPGIGGAAIPIRAGQNVIGTLDINVSLPRELTPDEIHLLTILSEIAGNAIQRATLHQQTERRLQQLTALSNIDRIITSTFDLHLSLGLLIGHVAVQLRADATDVLLFNPNSNILEFFVGRGFRTKPFERARLRLGEGYAGQAALTRAIIHIPNLAVQHDNPRLEKHLADEQFVSYFGVPLVSKGQIMGVLEIFQRAPFEPDQEWLDFLSTMAGQAAIAIDSVMQFDNVQRSNSELSQAYDETIEGWSHALDLRDHETEGHTQRVMEMTVALATAAGLGEAELLQVRWGSLLHDIGKMGIPDGILLKPGPLTEEEWVIMRKHPQYAHDMLSPIAYLRQALDIPYCHHERWDGAGYPRGLKDAQIPLTARIFAVVDVWDALTSDRPYRKAWTPEKAKEYISEQAGKQFDPEVAAAFLAEIQKGKA